MNNSLAKYEQPVLRPVRLGFLSHLPIVPNSLVKRKRIGLESISLEKSPSYHRGHRTSSRSIVSYQARKAPTSGIRIQDFAADQYHLGRIKMNWTIFNRMILVHKRNIRFPTNANSCFSLFKLTPAPSLCS